MITSFDAELTTNETNELCLALAGTLLGDVFPEKLREEVSALVVQREFAKLRDLVPDYNTVGVSTAMAIRQIAALFSKRVDIEYPGVDRTENAVRKFEDSERLCKETNDIFRAWSGGRFQFHPRVDAVFHSAARKIAQVLGDVPKVETLKYRFGPGATTQIQRMRAHPRYKLGVPLACSGDLSGTVQQYLEEVPSLFPCLAWKEKVTVPVEIHPGRLCFVLKNAMTDRSIIVEPSLNSFIQLGYADDIARKLKKHCRVDIHDQSRNQQAARRGSLFGDLATLDLVSASDLNARGLVAHLLPIDWYTTLSNICTSTYVRSDQQRPVPKHLHKFSSMGNGITFPLECLIFWALADSCREDDTEDTIVYGDDIIVPVSRVPLLRSVLHAAGFLLNKEKSFWEGPFRESCGADYLSGIDIRPVYVRDRIRGDAAFLLHNSFVRRQRDDLAAIVLEYIAPHVRLWGPDGYGDGHLISADSKHLRRDVKHARRGFGGYLFDTYTWKSRKTYRPSPGDAVLPAYTIYRERTPEIPKRTRELAYSRSVATTLYGEVGVRSIIERLHAADKASTTLYDDKGNLGVVLPGTNGYKRISIYTLSLG